MALCLSAPPFTAGFHAAQSPSCFVFGLFAAKRRAGRTGKIGDLVISAEPAVNGVPNDQSPVNGAWNSGSNQASVRTLPQHR
jgi:hypothetical protein